MKLIGVRLIIKASVILFFPVLSYQIFAQATCLSGDEVKKTIEQINNGQPQIANPALHRQLIEIQAKRQKLERMITDDWKKNQNLIQTAQESNKTQLLQLCELVRQNGWPTKEAVGEDGVAATLSIIQSGRSLELQKEIFPLAAAAAKKGAIGNNQIAPLIDNMRVEQGMPQIFGTQTYVKDELFYLYPLLSDTKVDDYRKLYGLQPLSAAMKYLLYEYGMPVIKSPRLPLSQKEKLEKKDSETNVGAEQLPDLERDEIVKVESNLVNLNVRIFNGGAAANDLNLQKTDFILFEDDKPQEISFFSTTETPFDLVLLLDLSGSTAGKLDLIRKSTEKFIEAARPSDRIAIITFTDDVKIVSDLTDNKEELLKKAKKIKDYGGSNIWFGIQSVYEQIFKTEVPGRRSAIVVMTDGVDSGLLPRHLTPENLPNFSDVLETVRNSNTTVIPIYLDTETKADSYYEKAYRIARQTLSMFAEESGGQMYQARKVEDLSGVYEQVIKDLGKIYSLGFEPSEVSRDGAWHNLTVKVLNHPELQVRTKKGFYAK